MGVLVTVGNVAILGFVKFKKDSTSSASEDIMPSINDARIKLREALKK
jgi:hypothetical protein